MPIFDISGNVLSALNVLGLEKLKSFQFVVEIDGELTGNKFVAGFQNIVGFSDRVNVSEVVELGYNGTHKFPRNSPQSGLTFSRGMTYDRTMWNWFQSAKNCYREKPDYRKTMSVYMIDYVNVFSNLAPFEVWRWNISGAWPSAWTGPRFNSNRESLAFESVTIQYHSFSEAKGILSGVTGEIASLIMT